MGNGRARSIHMLASDLAIKLDKSDDEMEDLACYL